MHGIVIQEVGYGEIATTLNEKTFRDRGSGFVVKWECLCKS